MKAATQVESSQESHNMTENIQESEFRVLPQPQDKCPLFQRDEDLPAIESFQINRLLADQSHNNPPTKIISSPPKQSIVKRIYKTLSVAGQRLVNQLRQQQFRQAIDETYDSTAVADPQWEKYKHSAKQRIEQFKTSGH